MLLPQRYVFSSKSQRTFWRIGIGQGCCCYHKGTYFQANHNWKSISSTSPYVVVATTKVRIFKQITTPTYSKYKYKRLLLLPQRYVFSSKSQHNTLKAFVGNGCCCYHKGTYFQANHNNASSVEVMSSVVVATTKVRIFKQITTASLTIGNSDVLLLLPQRYVFSSKSQRHCLINYQTSSCCCYHKGTYFQANHNPLTSIYNTVTVVVATTKVRIFKQITTPSYLQHISLKLLLLPQRYVFSSKPQHTLVLPISLNVVVATTKVRIFKQITTSGSISSIFPELLLLPQRYVFSSKSQRAC